MAAAPEIAGTLQPGEKHHGDAAVHADPVEGAVDHERDARHDARLLERDQQHHQRNHVGNDDADEADEAIQHGPADHALRRSRLPWGEEIGQAHRGHGVQPGAHLEHHEEDAREYEQASCEAPARVQEKPVEPRMLGGPQGRHGGRGAAAPVAAGAAAGRGRRVHPRTFRENPAVGLMRINWILSASISLQG
jgi:hypothetical protein